MSGLGVSLFNQAPKVNAYKTRCIVQDCMASRAVCFQMSVATKGLPLLRKLVVENSEKVSALMKVKYSPDRETAFLELYMQRSEVDHLIHQTMTNMDSATFGVITAHGGVAK